MEDNVKKLTPDDLQGLAGGWQDNENVTQEERDQWDALFKAYRDAMNRHDFEAAGPAFEAMMKFNDKMIAEYDR